MSNFRKKIKEYNRRIDREVTSEERVLKVVTAVKKSLANQRERMLSYAEFVFIQSRFIKKRWWLLQTMSLFVLWIMLGDMSDDYYLPRLLGMGAPLFVCLILPEIWKNRRYYSLEIEGSSYYSLRQIYSARMILFALMDILLLSLFWGISGLPLEIFIVNFILPLNICCSICFRLLYARRATMELTLIAIAVWTVLWLAVLANDGLYQTVILPMWGLYLVLSLGYLFYCVYKLQHLEEEMVCN